MSFKETSILLSLTTIIIYTTCQVSFGQMKTEDFTFEYDGKKLSGLLYLPTDEKSKAIGVMIHENGKANVVEGIYSDVRTKFNYFLKQVK